MKERDDTPGPSRLRNAVGLAILAAAFLWAAVHVTYQAFWTAGDVTVTGDRRIIRFAHWQLEGGIVPALHEACRLYESVRPDVDVQQIEVPERAYRQWVRTQLVGRTAPDLIEVWGPGNPAWDNLIVRYFVPVTERIDEPNPYNAADMDRRLAELVGQDPHRLDDIGGLQGVPWRDTYIDNMEGGWYDRLQDYYGMPMSVFTMRVFANLDILEKAAGDLLPRDPDSGALQGPPDLGTFFEVCRRITEYGKTQPEPILPIAGSDYVANIFRDRYSQMGTWKLLEPQDLDEGGSASMGERFLAFATGQIDLETDPCIADTHKLLYEISRHFNPGFMNAKREDSVFMFAQGRAAMMATGSWEAGTLHKQVEGMFGILIFDFPTPAPGQRYSNIIEHRISEAGIRAGFPLALTKFTKHPDLAVDFLHFLTSRRINEWLNQQFRWFPAVRGARMDPLLQAFEPKVEGVYKVFEPHLGGDSNLTYQQLYQGFIGRSPAPGLPFRDWLDDHYRQFIQTYAREFDKTFIADFERSWQRAYAAIVQSEAQLAAARARALRFGLTPSVQRNYAALVYGQTKRIGERTTDALYLQDGRAAYEQRKRGGAS